MDFLYRFSSWLSYTTVVGMASSPQIRSRKGSQDRCCKVFTDLWSLNPVTTHASLLVSVVFMPIGDLESCLSRRHPAIYLIINPTSWFNCSSNHRPRKGVRKNHFLATLLVRPMNIFGAGCYRSHFSVNQKRRAIESQARSTEQRVLVTVHGAAFLC